VVEHEPVCIADVMPDCRTMIEPLAQERGIQVTFPPRDLHLYVKGDRTRVKQVLINLLSNAIKYNRERGTVEVALEAVSPERIRISVKDKGPGLPPEKLAQLFQQFNRLGQEATSVEGTGIGLVVTKQLVELMGGEIGVESTVGAGSVFWFELPADKLPRPLAGQDKSIAVAAKD
jgi:signal transduction histidine kinase